MSFKRIQYNTGSEIFEIKIKDTTGGNIGNWTVMKENFMEWVDIMIKKYGIKAKPKSSNKDRDLDWVQ